MKRIAVLVFFLLGGFILAYSLQMQMYTTSGPGAGLFPAIIGGALCMLSLIWFVQVRRAPHEPADRTDTDRAISGRVGLQLLALVLFIVVFQWAGYIAAAAMLTVATSLVAGERNWLWIAVVTLITTAGVYYLFAALGTTI